MTIVDTKITRISKSILGYCSDLTSFITDRRLHLIGIGNPTGAIADNYTQWLIDGVPPIPNALDVGALNIQCFVPVTKLMPVVRQPVGNIVLSDDYQYIQMDTLNPFELADAICTDLYIEAEIHHNLLPPEISQYRSLYLCTNCITIDPLVNPGQVAMVEDTYYLVDSIINITPMVRTADMVHHIQFVKQFRVR